MIAYFTFYSLCILQIAWKNKADLYWLLSITIYWYRSLSKVAFITLLTRAVTTYVDIHVRCLFFCSILFELVFFSSRQVLVTPPHTKFDDNLSSESRKDRQVGRLTDRRDKTAAFRNFANASKREFANYVSRGRFARSYFMNKLASLIPHLPQDRESVPSVSGPHNLSFQQLSQCYPLTVFCGLQEAAFYWVLQQKSCWYLMSLTASLHASSCQKLNYTNCDDTLTECSFWPAKSERNE